MGRRKCVTCGNTGNIPNLTYHKFPTDKNLRKRWMQLLRVDSKIITTNSVVCSRHFNRNSFVKVGSRTFLTFYTTPIPRSLEKRRFSENKETNKTFRQNSSEGDAISPTRSENALNKSEHRELSTQRPTIENSHRFQHVIVFLKHNLLPQRNEETLQKRECGEHSRKCFRFFDDFRRIDLEDSTKREMFWNLASKIIRTQREQITDLQERNRKLKEILSKS